MVWMQAKYDALNLAALNDLPLTAPSYMPSLSRSWMTKEVYDEIGKTNAIFRKVREHMEASETTSTYGGRWRSSATTAT